MSERVGRMMKREAGKVTRMRKARECECEEGKEPNKKPFASCLPLLSLEPSTFHLGTLPPSAHSFANNNRSRPLAYRKPGKGFDVL